MKEDEFDMARYSEVLNTVLADRSKIEHVVCGHGSFMTGDELVARQDYLNNLIKGIRQGFAKGLDLETVILRFPFANYAYLSGLINKPLVELNKQNSSIIEKYWSLLQRKISKMELDRKEVRQFIGDIWFVVRSEEFAHDWGKAKNIGYPVNSEVNEACPTVAMNGNLYFHAVYPQGEGEADIYCAEYIEGKYTTPKKLSNAVNTKWGESNAFIAQDESYIIFGSRKPGGFGAGDLYISFRTDSGEWTKAVNMGNVINTYSSEYCPSVSPDGKYLFFTRIVGTDPRQADIFWVCSEIIDQLKNKRN